MLLTLKSLALFALAGILEIAGGWLIWQWIREDQSRWLGAIGGLVLVCYGIVPTLQPQHFARTYAAYGGFFIALSLVWGWLIDKQPPDSIDIVGSAIALSGVLVMYYWPR